MNQQPSKSDVKKWVRTLRSGKYSQDTHQLQTDNGMCCLGVACKVFIPKDKLNVNKNTGKLIGILPDMGVQPNAPTWLQDINNNFKAQVGFDLFYLNDGRNIADYGNVSSRIEQHSFDEIADTLEAVYIHEVLK